MNPNQPLIWISVLVGIALLAVAALAQPTFGEPLEKTIKLASAVLGFAMAIFAAVKSILGITQAFGLATREDVVPAGVTAGAGALLVLASAIA
jgi:hypothetical protein